MLKNIWKYSEKYKKLLRLLPLVIMAEVFLEVYIPYLMADIINEGVGEGNTALLVKTGLIMAAMSVLLVGTGFMQSYLCKTWATGFTKNLRSRLFAKVQGMSAGDVDRIGKASIITRMSTDMNYISRAMGMVHSFIKCPMMIIFTLIMTFRINTSLSWIFVAITPLFALVIYIITKLSRSHYRKMFKHYDAMNTVLEEDIVSAKTVKAFERRDYEINRFDGAAKSAYEESYAAERITVLNNPILQLAVNTGVLLLLYLGGMKIIGGSIEAGDLFCMITYTNQILGQVLIVALILVPILSAQISLERVFEVLSITPSLTDEDANIELEVSNGSVKLKDVSFSYFGKDSDKIVLSDINLDIPSGSFFGIIGASGSSKTTLINLLPRYYDCTQGEVFVGGHNVKDLSFKALRSAIGIVPQKSVLFSGTIRENLLWGNENATEEDMVSACKAADAHGFITAAPKGYNKSISEGGTNVSGGQRQRLCIARALIRKPKILILDDSLSAVDTLTDAKITHALKTQYPDTTVIMIAQRISTIKNADKIIVLDKGRISGMGTHEELLKSNKIYAEINESQKKSME